MKKLLLSLATLFFLCVSVSAQSDKEVEATIRKLDSLHAAAVLSGDLKEMDKYWTEDFIVTNPFNEIDRADRIRSGSLTYASFQRISEAIKVRGSTVIVMGKEIVIPKGNSPQAGKTINRRYTNIWMMVNGSWRLVARQASIICGS